MIARWSGQPAVSGRAAPGQEAAGHGAAGSKRRASASPEPWRQTGLRAPAAGQRAAGQGAAGPRRPVLPPAWHRLAPSAVLAAGLAFAAAGCGPSHAAATVRQCGTAKTAANVPVKIEVIRGQVSCADAMTVEHAYTKAILDGQEPGNGGGGPVQVSGWRCQGFPTPEVLKTGKASRCTRSGTEILAILPPPS